MDNRQIERVKEKAPFRGNSSIGRNTNFNAFNPTPTSFIPPRDPNAMDIDRISVEEQQNLMKTGFCFYCKEKGHIAKNCPKKGRMPARDQKKPERRNINFARTEEKKDGAEEAYNEVQKALSSLTEDDYQKFQELQNRRGGF